MDTRQLAAFCAVVDRKSFSQAAELLGISQPAVSLQIRSLEERLGTQLIDRSGRRVEPTEAGSRLYRGAQRLLALEEQLLEDVAAGDEGPLHGRLELGASSGPGETVLPVLLGEFQREHPDVHVALAVHDTQTIVDLVARRELELGVVGASRRHRGVTFEPFFRDEVILVCPPGHRFAGRTISVEELKAEPLILMQEAAGVAVRAGYGVTFISRTSVETDLAEGAVAEARVEGLEPAREISLVRASGRRPTRVAEAFVAFARDRL